MLQQIDNEADNSNSLFLSPPFLSTQYHRVICIEDIGEGKKFAGREGNGKEKEMKKIRRGIVL